MQYTVYQLVADKVDDIILRQMAELALQTWPKDGQTVEDRIAFWKQLDVLPDAAEYSFALDAEQKILAMARTFGRWIMVDDVRYHCMALASVVVRPNMRGNGLGKAIVQSAFSRVDKGEFHISLFQTGVPEFYESLGCETVNNKVINSLAEDKQACPFWDKYVMCYPEVIFDNSAVIDLRGTGY